jgi:enoyl-CoA hydratase/carnithine racemase
MSETPVLFETFALADSKLLARIHLNSPKSFNSLSLDMVNLIQAQLNKWREDDSICAIFLDGSGEKAFCAGGDVKGLYYGRVDSEAGIDNPTAIDFFDQEYTLDYDLHTFPKPIICWGNGVVMGGGLGLMVGCTHRIVTETSRSAMPEITIGLFPDVGGSWFLNRSPGKTGLFLGLTGCNINAHDAIYTGLANRFIANEYKETVLTELVKLSSQDIVDGKLTQLLKSFEEKSSALLPQSELKTHASLIDQLCDFENITDIANAIVNSCKNNDNRWLSAAADTLSKGCPITAHLVFEQLTRAKHLSLAQVFIMERNISAQCMKQADFYEGVRALLIDKDKSPRWTHESIAQVDKEFIESYF